MNCLKHMFMYKEEWTPLVLYNAKPYYSISTHGRIFSTYYNKFIIPHENHNGYLQASIMTNDGGRIFRKVHRLVLMTFKYIDGCELLEVNHIDGDKHNNYLGNLEWVTSKENNNHAIKYDLKKVAGEFNGRATITNENAIKISEMILNGFSDSYIADYIGCSTGVIKEIALGHTWTHLFSPEILNSMKRTRIGYTLTLEEKNMICKYYQDHIHEYENDYKKAKHITEAALYNLGIAINDTNIRIARRLFFRLQNPEITNNYAY